MTLRNEDRVILDTVVLGGVTVTVTEISYDYKPWSRTGDAPIERSSYKSIDLEGSEGDDLAHLNAARIVLEALAQLDDDFTLANGYYDLETIVEYIEETASELAEGLEIHFIYERNGRQREYTPRSLWEPSGGCEWDESASEYDYGWDL